MDFSTNGVGNFQSTKVVVLSDKREEDEMLTSILAGVSGYVSRNADGPELVRAIRTAYSGGGYFDLEVVGRVIDRLQRAANSSPTIPIPDALSEREVNILKMVGEGYTNREISQRLNIAPATVRNHITHIRTKLGLDSRHKLIAYAFRHGLIDEPADGFSAPVAAN